MAFWHKWLNFWNKIFVKNQNRTKVIFLLGPSGSGKTTNARLYRDKHLECCLIRVSHLLREEIRNSQRWQVVNLKRRMMAQNFERAIKAGKLTDPKETWMLIKRAFSKAKNNFIIVDGFPRSLDYYQQIQADDCEVLGLIYLDVSPEEAKRRMTAQANRADKTEEAMRARAQFVELMRPVLEEFERQNKLCRVDASGTVEQTQVMFAAAVETLKEK